MARTRRTQSTTEGVITLAVRGAAERVGAALAAWPAGRWVATALLVVLPVVLCMGFARMERYVHAQPHYDQALMLKWVDLPPWLRVPENRHVLDGLARTVNLQSTDRLLDRTLAERLGLALADPGIGWVRSVERVRVEPSGEVSVKCSFRAPTAWVRHGPHGYLVDEAGVRLPGTYDLDDCRGGAMLVIEGVAATPPPVGQTWEGADLAAALKMTALLADRPFRRQIASVIVTNHNGRQDRSKPHIELGTDVATSRIWWGRSPDEEFGTEITAEQKLTLLETMYRQWGRVDMHRSYVNIMTWPDRVAMPAAMQGQGAGAGQGMGQGARSRLLRG